MNATNHSYFLISLLVAVLIAVCILFAPYLSVFVLAVVFGVIFNPLHKILEKYLKNQSLSAIVSTLIVLIIIIGPVTFVFTQVLNEAQNLNSEIQNNSYDVNTAVSFIEGKLQNYFPYLHFDLRSHLEAGLSWVLQNAGNAFSSAVKTILNFLLSIIALYYWFKDSDKLKSAVLKLSPLPDEDDEMIADKLSISIHSVVRGTIVVAIIQGFLTGVGFLLFGVPHAILWGTVASVSALIPGIGTALVLIPAIVYLYVIGAMFPALGLALWGICAVGLIDNFLGPKLMSRGGMVHPFFILIGALGGIRLFGPVGFLVGPLLLSFFFALFDIYFMYVTKGKQAQRV